MLKVDRREILKNIATVHLDGSYRPFFDKTHDVEARAALLANAVDGLYGAGREIADELLAKLKSPVETDRDLRFVIHTIINDVFLKGTGYVVTSVAIEKDVHATTFNGDVVKLIEVDGRTYQIIITYFELAEANCQNMLEGRLIRLFCSGLRRLQSR